MRLALLLILCSLAPHGLAAQPFPDCQTRHFAGTRIVSTRICWDTDHRWGRAWAYDRHGNVLFDKHLRRVGGHASVTFNYHPNGAVAKAEFSSAPDAGIQWYHSQTTWDDQGRQTSHNVQTHDDRPSIVSPVRPGETEEPIAPPVVPRPAHPQIVVEAPVHRSLGFYINSTGRLIRLTWRTDGQSHQATLQPGDTLRATEVLNIGHFTPPDERIPVQAVELRRRNYLPLDIHWLKARTRQPNPTEAHYFYRIYAVRGR